MVRILRNSRMDSVKRAAIFFIAFPPSTDIGPQKEIMGLSSAAARCGLYTASRTGFSSNRQLSVLPALNAYKPTLHVLFFVSFPIITVQPAIYNSYFRKICHGLRSFLKKGRICFSIRPFQIEFYFPPIPLTLRTGCYTALHKSRSVQAVFRGCPAR